MTEPPPQLKRTRSGNMKEPPPKPTYRSVKTSLKSAVKNTRHGSMRRQITEAQLLERFEELFGSGADTTAAIGDWSQRQHRRFKELVKGKGFRTTFQKAGHDVYLVDEFRTSSRCSVCEQGARRSGNARTLDRTEAA